MRWHHLFDDLEAQMMRAERDAFEDEVRARAVAERATVAFSHVLAAARGARVRVVLTDGAGIEGAVTDSAAQWLHLEQGAREWLVPAHAIVTLEGVPAGAPEPGLVASRLTLGHALRALAEGGADVVVSHAGGVARGRIAAVGADYVAVGALLVPFRSIIAVSPAP